MKVQNIAFSLQPEIGCFHGLQTQKFLHGITKLSDWLPHCLHVGGLHCTFLSILILNEISK